MAHEWQFIWDIWDMFGTFMGHMGHVWDIHETGYRIISPLVL